MTGYIKPENPFIVPTTDGKKIEEHFGNASYAGGNCSVAHMTAPAGWREPFQTPEFDEFTIMVSGRKRIEFDDEVVEIGPGESILVKANTRVRYSNPFDEQADYWSVCIPAFSIETVHREDEDAG